MCIRDSATLMRRDCLCSQRWNTEVGDKLRHSFLCVSRPTPVVYKRMYYALHTFGWRNHGRSWLTHWHDKLFFAVSVSLSLTLTQILSTQYYVVKNPYKSFLGFIYVTLNKITIYIHYSPKYNRARIVPLQNPLNERFYALSLIHI